MDKRSAKKVGKLGEDELRKWAHQADITVNKSTEDEKGWDFLLEFYPQKKLTYDTRPASISCWVQVKATDKKFEPQDIKLSSWEYLIKSPLPAFFLICEFDGEDTCQRAYLVHVDEEIRRKAFKKLRELNLKKKPLNKSRLRLTYDDTHALIQLNGKGLIEAIINYVPTSLEDYTKKKLEVNASMGYEEGGYQITVSYALPDGVTNHIEYLVDFLLGIVPAIESARVEQKDIRFGIEAPELTKIFENSYVTVETKPVGEATFIFKIPGELHIRIKAKIYRPNGMGCLPNQYWKLWFRSPLIDVIFSPNSPGTITLHGIELQDKHLLSDLYPRANLIILAHKAMERGDKVDFEAWLESMYDSNLLEMPRRFLSSQLSGNSILHDDNRNIFETICAAWTVAKYFDIQNEVVVSVNQLLPFEKPLKFLAMLIEAKHVPFRLTFFTDHRQKEDRTVCYPDIFIFKLGQYSLVVGMTVSGNAKLLSETEEGSYSWEVKTDDVKLHQGQILHRDDNLRERAGTVLKSIIDEYKQMSVIYLSDESKELLGSLD